MENKCLLSLNTDCTRIIHRLNAERALTIAHFPIPTKNTNFVFESHTKLLSPAAAASVVYTQISLFIYNIKKIVAQSLTSTFYLHAMIMLNSREAPRINSPQTYEQK